MEGAGVRLFQGEGTAFAALQKPEQAEGRGWRKVDEQDRARASPACFDTVPPTMQSRSHCLHLWSLQWARDPKCFSETVQ